MPADTARVRRQPCRVPAPASLLNPRRDRLGISAGQPAQDGRLAGQRFIQFALRGTLEQAGHLSQEISPPGCQLAQSVRRGALLGLGEVAPLRPEPGFAGELSYEYPVCLRAIIDHEFEYRNRSLGGIWRPLPGLLIQPRPFILGLEAPVKTSRDPGRVPPAAPFLDPHRYRVFVRTGEAAEFGRIAGPLLVFAAFCLAFEDAGYLGQQISTAASQLAECR